MVMTPEQASQLRTRLNDFAVHQQQQQQQHGRSLRHAAPAATATTRARSASTTTTPRAPPQSQPERAAMRQQHVRRAPSHSRAAHFAVNPQQQQQMPEAHSRRHRNAVIVPQTGADDSQLTRSPPGSGSPGAGAESPNSSALNIERKLQKYELYKECYKRLRNDTKSAQAEMAGLQRQLHATQADLDVAQSNAQLNEAFKKEMTRLQDEVVFQMEEKEQLSLQASEVRTQMALLQEQLERALNTQQRRERDLHRLLDVKDGLQEDLARQNDAFGQQMEDARRTRSQLEEVVSSCTAEVGRLSTERDELRLRLGQLQQQQQQPREDVGVEVQAEDMPKEASPREPPPAPTTPNYDERLHQAVLARDVLQREVAMLKDQLGQQTRSEGQLRNQLAEHIRHQGQLEERLRAEQAKQQGEPDAAERLEQLKQQEDARLAEHYRQQGRMEEMERNQSENKQRAESERAEVRSHTSGMVTFEAFAALQSERDELRDHLRQVEGALTNSQDVARDFESELSQAKVELAQMKRRPAPAAASPSPPTFQQQQQQRPSSSSPHIANPFDSSPEPPYHSNSFQSGPPPKSQSQSSTATTNEVNQLRFSLTQARNQLRDLKFQLSEQHASAQRAMVSLQAEVSEHQNRTMRSEAHAAQARSTFQNTETHLKYELEQAQSKFVELRKQYESARSQLSFQSMRGSATEATLRKASATVYEQRKLLQRLQTEGKVAKDAMEQFEQPPEMPSPADAEAKVSPEILRAAQKKVIALHKHLSVLNGRYDVVFKSKPASGCNNAEALREGLRGVATKLQRQVGAVETLSAGSRTPKTGSTTPVAESNEKQSGASGGTNKKKSGKKR